MNLFRVDTRIFKVGESILPESNFEGRLTDERLELENLLNELRPSEVPERGKCLFLFQDLAGALRHVAKYGGYIYSVTPDQVYSRGDINKLDNMLDVFRFTDDERMRKAVVNEYWKEGSHTYNPCYEILANQCVVESVICGEEIQEKLKKELRFMGNCIEHCSTYIELIKVAQYH